ncbi:MAG: DoxX family protein [Pseudomonadota bacterium]|nr:DoxX family protein [Pseudomonadota bacterium]
MNKSNPVFSLAGCAMIALIFILSGLSKLSAIEGMQGYMESAGLPGILIYPAILFEVGAGLAIIAGFQTRIVAFLLAGFSLFTAFIFHNQLGDQMQFIMFMKNVAIAGGLLFLVRNGAGELSLDNRRSAAAISASA